MTNEEALRWVADLFEQPVEMIKPETPREQIPTWDSLGVLTLMAEFDEKHGILLSDQHMQTMVKVGDILEVLQKNGKLS